jgi:hypothetical protein
MIIESILIGSVIHVYSRVLNRFRRRKCMHKIFSRAIISAIFVLIGFFFFGCTGLPERVKPDDSVAVLKINRIFMDEKGAVIERPSAYQTLHVYYMHVDDSPNGFLADQTDDHIYFKGLAPGYHMITFYTIRFINATGPDETKRITVPFKLEAGHATVIDFSFDYLIYYHSTFGYGFGDRFKALSPEDKKKLIEKLAESPSFKTWDFVE